MAGQMDEGYFDEKKQLVQKAIASANEDVANALGIIEATSYAMNDLVTPAQIHELLKSAAIKLDAARRDFEKTRWPASRTDLQFEQWLAVHGHSDLCLKQD